MFPVVMVWSLTFPPLQYSSGFLALQHLSRLLSLFVLNCLLSARFCVFSRPPPASGHPSSVGRKATNPPVDGRPMSSPGFLSSVPYAGFHPSSTCAAGGTWLGCGWRDEVDGAPAMVLSPLTRRQASPGLVCLRQRSSSLFDYFGARLSVCPPLAPPPFPVQLYVSLYSPS